MNIQLDPHTGHLRLPSGRAIHPALRPTEVAALGASQPPTYRDVGTGWHWYHLQFSAAPYSVGINQGFWQEQLRGCLVGWFIGSQPTSWADWNEAAELRQAQEFEKWLAQQLGPTRIFGWGTAWAGYDPRSAGSSIAIWYSPA